MKKTNILICIQTIMILLIISCTQNLQNYDINKEKEIDTNKKDYINVSINVSGLEKIIKTPADEEVSEEDLTNRSLFKKDFNSILIKAESLDITNTVETTLSIVNGTASGVLQVPTGNNIIFTATALDDGGNPISGAVLRSIADIYFGNNLVNLNWMSSSNANVFYEFYKYDKLNGTTYSQSLNKVSIGNFIYQMYLTYTPAHYSFIDSLKIAQDILSLGGSLPDSTSDYIINPGQVKFQLSNLNTTLNVYATDPASQNFSISTNGVYTINNVLPGNEWKLVFEINSSGVTKRYEIDDVTSNILITTGSADGTDDTVDFMTLDYLNFFPQYPLTENVYKDGSINAGEYVWYYFDVTQDNKYQIYWDDIIGSGSYNCDIEVFIYSANRLTMISGYYDTAYSTPVSYIPTYTGRCYLKVAGDYSDSFGSFALKYDEITGSKIKLNISEDSTTDFGSIESGLSKETRYTITNDGISDLLLTGSPIIEISGDNSEDFSINIIGTQSTVIESSNTEFGIVFNPQSTGLKKAVVKIYSNDPDNSLFVFNVTGNALTPAIQHELTDDIYLPDSIVAGEYKWYYFDATQDIKYLIYWDDADGSGNYSCDIKVTIFREDKTTIIGGYYDSGYFSPRSIVSSYTEKVYLKVEGLSSGNDGPFAIKYSEVTGSRISLDIAEDTTSDFGSAEITLPVTKTYTISNIYGINDLLLTGTPIIQISGDNSSDFVANITSTLTTITSGSSTTFKILFNPQSSGQKSALVTISSNDPKNPEYTFKITGNSLGAVTQIELTDDIYYPDSIIAGEYKWYYFDATQDSKYLLSWDDGPSGSGAYTCDIEVYIYSSDRSTILGGSYDSAYFSPITYTPSSTGRVYLKVAGDYISSNGTYTLKYEEVTGSKIQATVPEDTTADLMMTEIGTPVSMTLWISNYYGASNLILSGTPIIEITGTDGGNFSIDFTNTQSTILPGNSTSFDIIFNPLSIGEKNATVTICSNDPKNSVYTFYIQGKSNTPQELTNDIYYPDSIVDGEYKWYYFDATQDVEYLLNWDDSYQGSGTYSCDIKVYIYNSDRTSVLGGSYDSGYTTLRTYIPTITGRIYLKVMGYDIFNHGTYAIKFREN